MALYNTSKILESSVAGLSVVYAFGIDLLKLEVMNWSFRVNNCKLN